MPKAAIETNAASEVLPVDKIGQRAAAIFQQLAKQSERAPDSSTTIHPAASEQLPPFPSPDYHVMVLLVDDQAFSLRSHPPAASANQPDIDFHYCADPQEAVALANHIKPTVILQDLVMPEVDGLTLVSRFRANPVHARHAHRGAFHER